MKRNYLDLSTAHLSPATRTDLKVGSVLRCTVAPYEYGYFVSVPPNQEGIAAIELRDVDNDMLLPRPDDLIGVLRYARKHGCSIVRFDTDADKIEELPVFED